MRGQGAGPKRWGGGARRGLSVERRTRAGGGAGRRNWAAGGGRPSPGLGL